MLSQFERTGIWWSPCGTLEKVSGTITHEATDSSTLTITYESSYYPFGASEKLSDILRIYGKLDDGKYATLVDFFVSSHSTNGNGVNTVRFTVNLLLVGSELAEAQDLVFESSSVVVEGIESWLDYRALNQDQPEGGNVPFQLAVRHSPRTHFSEYISAAGARIELRNIGNYHSEEGHHRIQNYEKLELRPRSKKPFEWHSRTAFQFVELVSIFHSRPIRTVSLVLRERKSRDSKRHAYDPFFAAVYPTHSFNARNNSRASNVIFGFPELKSRLKNILNNFYALPEETLTASGMFYALNSRWPGLDVRLIFLIQAYEAVYSTDRKGLHVSKTKYKQLRKEIKVALADTLEHHPSLLDSIINSIGYANSLTLRDKMKIQAEGLGEITCGRIFVDDYDSVIGNIVSTRNHLTHRSVSTRTAAVVFGPKLYNVTEVLSWMVWIILVQSIGISKFELQNKIEKSRVFDKNQRSRVDSSE